MTCDETLEGLVVGAGASGVRVARKHAGIDHFVASLCELRR